MSLGARTPRDQLDRIIALIRRSFRYLWVAGLITIIGAALALAFAMTRSRSYVSQTVFLHREVIPSNIISGNNAVASSRNMGIRFREMVLASPLLEKTIIQFNLFPSVIDKQGMSAAIEELREAISFRTSGFGTFSIQFKGDTPDEAQKVTAHLAKLLIEWEKKIQLESVSVTRNFLEEERARVEGELREREKALAEFLAQHPEFAQETSATGSQAGASIRARTTRGNAATRDPKLHALQRQSSRIRARLAAPVDEAPAPRTPATTPEQLQARQEAEAARRALGQAQRDLDDKLGRYTELHPDVVAAKRKVEAADGRMKRAQAAVVAAAPPAERPALQPVTDVERESLRVELARLEREIRAYRKSSNDKAPSDDTKANWVVELETDWTRLLREVEERRDRYEGIEAKAYTAEVVAASELARQGDQLSIIEPASLPTRPAGTPRSLMVIAGVLLFGCIGATVALLLALLDDRIVGRYDIERLEIVPVLVVVPKVKAARGKARG